MAVTAAGSVRCQPRACTVPFNLLGKTRFMGKKQAPISGCTCAVLETFGALCALSRRCVRLSVPRPCKAAPAPPALHSRPRAMASSLFSRSLFPSALSFLLAYLIPGESRPSHGLSLTGPTLSLLFWREVCKDVRVAPRDPGESWPLHLPLLAACDQYSPWFLGRNREQKWLC